MRFPYDTAHRPTLPIALRGPSGKIQLTALVDSGADVNVLPWGVGRELGLVWNPNKATLRLVGAMERSAAMPVLLELSMAGFEPVTQAFAWCQSDAVKAVLGQTNFFMEFDVCFFRSKSEFAVEWRTNA